MKRPRNLFLLLLSSLLPATTYADSVTIRAAGIDTKTGEKIFTEMSRARFKDGLILSAESEFRDVAGNVYTRQKVEVKKSSVAPDYTLHDLRDGHREAVRHTGAGYEILFKADAKAAETLPGFSNFVVTHWDALIAGKAMYFYLILPTQRDYYRFRLIRDSATAGQVRFRIELENFVLRMFVDAIRISFDIGKKRLVGYEGIHFVRDLPKFLGRKMRVTYKAD
jgi:hypothetical protein